MDNKMIFRRATTKDLKGILNLNFELFKKEYNEFDKSLNLKWTFGREGRKYFKEKITKKDSFVEVAELEGRIIAYLCGGMSERLFYRKDGKYAELENMFIDKNFRRKGIGEKLTKNFVIWCKKNKVDNVSVTASSKNSPAVSLYRKAGFKDYNLTLELNL